MIELRPIIDAQHLDHPGNGRLHVPYCYEQSWITMFQQVFSYKIKGYGLYSQGQNIGSFLYVVMRSRLWGNRIVSLPFADEGGVMVDAPEALSPGLKQQVLETVVQKINEEALLHKAVYAEMRGDAFLFSEPSAGAFFLKRKAYVKFVLDTRISYQDLRKKFHSNIIKNLRKADKYVGTRECRSLDEVGEVYQIYLLEMRRLGGLPLPISYFEVLWRQKSAKIFLAIVSNKIVGFLMLLTLRQRAMADINASLESARQFFPKVRLYDEAIRWSCENEIESFDFMRTRPETGLYWHKMKWGGMEEPIFYYTRLYNKQANYVLDADQKRFYFPRLLVRQMPLMFLKKLGPFLRVGLGK